MVVNTWKKRQYEFHQNAILLIMNESYRVNAIKLLTFRLPMCMYVMYGYVWMRCVYGMPRRIWKEIQFFAKWSNFFFVLFRSLLADVNFIGIFAVWCLCACARVSVSHSSYICVNAYPLKVHAHIHTNLDHTHTHTHIYTPFNIWVQFICKYSITSAILPFAIDVYSHVNGRVRIHIY